MSFSWQKMTDDDFAAFQRLMGLKVRQVSGHYWTAVRPLFYRPIWPFRQLASDQIALPLTAHLGGAQYPVAPGAPANSHLNLIIFEQTAAYDPEALHRNERRQIRVASRDYVIRPIDHVSDFKRDAFPAYLSFYNRTQYQVGAKRRDNAYFSQWADRLFQIPNVRVLGGYRGSELAGVSLSFLVDDTIDYASYFCDAQALKQHLSDLMLHTLRESAAKTAGVNRIFMGSFKGDPGLDDFKFLRGAKLLRQPAFLDVNPLAKAALGKLLPKQYAQLLGRLSPEQMTRYQDKLIVTAG